MIAKHHEDRWTKLDSHWNPLISTKQKGYRKQRRLAKRWEDDLNTYSQPDRANRDNNDLTSDITWLTSTTHDLYQHDPRQPNQQHTSKQRTRLPPTTKTNTTPKTTRTTRYGSSANHLIVEPPLHQHDSNKDTMQAHFISSGKRSERNTLFNLSCVDRFFCSPTREGARLKHSGPWGKSALRLHGVYCTNDHLSLSLQQLATPPTSSLCKDRHDGGRGYTSTGPETGVHLCTGKHPPNLATKPYCGVHQHGCRHCGVRTTQPPPSLTHVHSPSGERFQRCVMIWCLRGRNHCNEVTE